MVLQVYDSFDGWRIRLIASNGRILMSSEAYSRKSKAMQTAKKIRDLWNQQNTLIEIVTKGGD